MNDNCIIKFSKYCLDASLSFPDEINNIDWQYLMTFAQQQAIVGIIYQGLERSGKDVSIPIEILMQWIEAANQIEVQNSVVNRYCKEAISEYKKVGYDCMVLKGQGNALMYPYPLLRTPGDIDILLCDVSRKNVIKYVKRNHKVIDIRYHHIEYMYNGVPVEIHFFPCQMNNPVYHWRLMRWLKTHEKLNNERALPNEEESIPVPA